MPGDRPILFSSEMVRAILDGRKTMTRRVVKPQPIAKEHSRGTCYSWGEPGGKRIPGGPRFACGGAAVSITDLIGEYCPYGKVGDVLWVRETTWYREEDGVTAYTDGSLLTHPTALYGNKLIQAEKPPEDNWPSNYREFGFRVVPSIHMPRRVSRITLEVTGVRVERLQEITEEDAEAEGFHREGCGGEGNVRTFARLWNKINGADSWESNPWVWCISFRRLDAARAAIAKATKTERGE